MKSRFLLAGMALLISSSANAIDFGVGVKAGTAGVGAELSVALTRTINFRVAVSQIDTDFDETLEIDDGSNNATIDADVILDFGASALLFDWYVFDGTFHITTGMVKNNSKIDLEGTLVGDTVTFNGTDYDIDTQFVDRSMTGKVDAGDSYEPYLGIGWGRKADDDPGLSLSVELGVVLMDPSVELTAPTAVNPLLQAQLDADVQSAENAAADDLSDLEAYPVLSVGLNYAF